MPSSQQLHAYAFEAIIQSNQGSVYAVALAITLDSDVASDAAQETFIQAWKGLSKLRDKSRLIPLVAQLKTTLPSRRVRAELASDVLLSLSQQSKASAAGTAAASTTTSHVLRLRSLSLPSSSPWLVSQYRPRVAN